MAHELLRVAQGRGPQAGRRGLSRRDIPRDIHFGGAAERRGERPPSGALACRSLRGRFALVERGPPRRRRGRGLRGVCGVCGACGRAVRRYVLSASSSWLNTDSVRNQESTLLQRPRSRLCRR